MLLLFRVVKEIVQMWFYLCSFVGVYVLASDTELLSHDKRK
jgi:hypothetical protein